MKVSVIIPFYNAEDSILLCLEGLTNQDVLPDEIIFIDNNSTDSTAEKIKKFTHNIKDLRIILTNETKKGPAVARNKGLSIAQGDIIAFTDSDCIPRKDWIKNILKEFKEEDPDIIGGIIKGYSYSGLINKFMELYRLNSQRQDPKQLCHKKHLIANEFFGTNNAALTKKTLQELKGFDENFYPTGEDTDLCLRAVENGFKIISWIQDVVVYHIDRKSLKLMIKQLFYYKVGTAKIIKKHFSKSIILQFPFLGILEIKDSFFTLWMNSFSIISISFLIIFSILIYKNLYYLSIAVSLILIYSITDINYRLKQTDLKGPFLESIGLSSLLIIQRIVGIAAKIYSSLKYRIIYL